MMKPAIKSLALAGTMFFVSGAVIADGHSALEKAVAENPARSEAEMDRDQYRHPIETLSFFGITEDMSVGEVNPGRGWYSNILGPLLKDDGLYVGLEHHSSQYAEYEQYAAALAKYPETFDEKREVFGDKAIAGFLGSPEGEPLPVDAGSLDAVIAVRALHGWVLRNFFDDAIEEVWQMLKPGGTFGVVQHRAAPDALGNHFRTTQSARWKQAELISAVESYGFELVATSEINANPKDEKNYPRGVWTLPPILALGDEDKEKYLAVGESDRMTLKFKKVER